MPDRMTPEQRHANMAAIHSKNTSPERIVRSYLWKHGFRYRLNENRLPGKPDIVLRKYHTCIFVNGCFWHGHHIASEEEEKNNTSSTLSDWHNFPEDKYGLIQSSGCCKIPKTNRDFWLKKILRNKERDEKVLLQLHNLGWHCITIWECDLSTKPSSLQVDDKETRGAALSIRERTLQSLCYTLNKIFLLDRRPKPYTLPQEDELLLAAEE